MYARKAFIGVLSVFIILFMTSCGSKNVKKAKEFMDIKMYDQALEVLQKEILENPNNDEAHFLAGKVYLLKGNEAKAQESFERAIMLKTSYKTEIGKTYFLVAETLQGESDAKLLRLYQAAVQYDISLKGQIAQTFFMKASSLSQTEHTSEKPITYLQYSIDLDEGYREKVADFAYETSQKYTEKGLLHEALQYAYFSKEINPKNIQSIGKLLYGIGIRFGEQGEKEKFIEAITQGKEWYPNYKKDDGNFLWWMGEYHYFLGEIDVAKNYYEQIITQFSNTPIEQKAVKALAEIKQRESGIIGVYNVSELQSNHPEVFEVREGKSLKATFTQGYLCYGPYVKKYPVKPLDVYFSIFIDNNSADNRNIVSLDVYDSFRERILAQQTIYRKNFPKAGDFNLFKLSFTPVEGSVLEFRIYYFGFAHVIADKIAVIDPTKMTVKDHSDIEKLSSARIKLQP